MLALRPSSHVQSRRPGTRSRWRLHLTSALLLCFGSIMPACGAEEPPSLRVAVSRSISPPFVVWRDQQASAGIDVEIAQELAVALKTRVEWLALPRLRVEGALLSGEADIACNLSPLQSPRPESLPQSPPLFELQDMLSAHPSAASVDTLEQVPPGAVIGTLQAQAYPALEALFQQGRAKRDDALDEERMLRKLAKDRHPYGVSSRQTLSWFNLQAGASSPNGEERLASWRLLLGSRPYRCAVSPRGRFEARQLLAGLDQLLSSGRIEQIVATRSAPALAVVVSVRSPLREVSRSALAELFLGQRPSLLDQGPALPVMSAGPERQQFLAHVLQREPAQYRASWAAQQFGGRRRAPTELSSPEATKSFLQRHTEAIGYLPLALVDSTLRIVYMP